MFKENSTPVLLFCAIVTIASAVLQYLNPSFSFFDGGLITAILLTIFLKKNQYTLLFGAISAALIIIATFYDTNGEASGQLVLQHAFGLIIVVMATAFVLYVKQLYRNIDSDQQQLAALFANATEGIILTNDKGQIVLLNPAAYRLFEYKSDELPGQPIDLLIPQRFRERHTEYREGFYHQPGNRTMGQGRDLFARKKNGQEFPVEVSLSYYKQKNTLYVIAFIVDITQRKQAEQELVARQQQLEKITEEIRKLNAGLETKVEQRTLILREALQELERSQKELNEALDKEKELNEIKSRFVSMASHEFRTPLSTVLSSAALLGRYTQNEDQEKRDKHIRRIKDSVKHLNTLLEDFLSLGKLEEGKVKAEPAQFVIKDFLDEVIEEMRPLAKDGQEIACDFPAGNATFVSDKRLLKNILINLLSNAVKFSPEGAVIHLDASLSKDGRLKLYVRDKGIGISEEDQQHLFSSFFRGANALNIEGTGLGLHIVKRYLDLLYGSIYLQSALNEGTTITIDVPDQSIPH